MGRPGRFATVLPAAVLVMSAAACTADSSSGGEGSASCAGRFTYEERSYGDVANVDFTVGKKLGTATAPPCDDTGDRDRTEAPGTTQTVYQVEGISPEVAVAMGGVPEEAAFYAVRSGPELPPELQRMIDGS